MANPIEIVIPIDVWTKVATSVLNGAVYPLKTLSSGGNYIQTHRLTAGAAPTDGDTSEGVVLPPSGGVIDSDNLIDIYVSVTGDEAGRVRVDV